jgi:NAD(P)H-flavin reductase
MTAAPLPQMEPDLFRVHSVSKETPDTFTFVLEPEEGTAWQPFQPGQFSMLYVFGVGELPISISGDPGRNGRLVYTVRAVGQATRSLVSVKRGDTVGVRGPFGVGWPMEQARGKDILIAAGGIGLAPLRPVIYHVMRHRADFGRVIVLYGARSPRDQLFGKELSEWSRQANTQVLTTVDYGALSWRGHVGVVTTLFRYVRLQPDRAVAMICGPEIMMRFVAREVGLRGVPAESTYLSMERNMKCALGFCGHCQYGPHFICKDGPVFSYDRIRTSMDRYEL